MPEKKQNKATPEKSDGVSAQVGAESAAEASEKGSAASDKKTAADVKNAEKKSYLAAERDSDGSLHRLILGANTEKLIVLDLKLIWKLISYAAAIIIFLLSAGITVYYVTVAAKGEFHSDCTDTIMWANASYESSSVYDENFHYACFLPFGVNLIMQPFISAFGVSMTTHIIGMTGFFILFTVFFCLMLLELHKDIRYMCIGTSILLALTLSSQKVREIFWGHTIYYSLGLLFIVMGMYMYARLLNLREKRAKLTQQGKSVKAADVHYCVTFIILCIFIMFTATDGISGLSIFALPFIAGIFAESFTDTDVPLISKRFGRVVIRAAIFAVMVLIGIKLNDKWTGDMVAGYQEANSKYSSMDTWTDHLHSLPLAWMKLFGVENMDGKLLSDQEGIFNLLRIAAALLIAVLPVIATCFYPKYEKNSSGRAIRIFVWIHWAVTAIVLMGYIFGVLAGADWRLVPVMGTSVMLSLLFVQRTIQSRMSAGRVAALLMIPIIAVSYLDLKNVREMKKDNYKDNVLFSIADYLEEEGLTYGYATFWNANAITVISDSEVKVRDVIVDENGVWKRLYQSSDKWYEAQEGQQEYFLLLSVGEYDTLAAIENSIVYSAVREYTPVLNNLQYHILVYDHNIF